MMTKDEEREVLKKIKKLIDSTGADSYIEAAFDGCVELAEENITNDFLTSFKQTAENAHAAELEARARAQELKERLDHQEQQLEELYNQNEELKRNNKEQAEMIRDYALQLSEATKKDAAKFDRIQELEKELIALKAKLYDLMTA